ncbi:coiled-coil domain-containing protein 82-like [Ptychodera flava]|uniref:coiled-coil domain-containing protein 82-like n=1 Tax=Ptychodera flava TaxID=63121 RepID=UPI00396A38D2
MSKETNRIFTSKNAQVHGSDSSEKQPTKDSHRSSLSWDDENVPPENQIPVNGSRNGSTDEGAKTRRKRDGSRNFRSGIVNLPGTTLRRQIDSDEDNCVDVKRPRRQPHFHIYNEDEDKSRRSDKEEQNESGNGPEPDTDDVFHSYEHVQEQGENSGDTQDRSDTRKNDGPRHLHFGNVNSTSTIPIIQIESDEEDAINVKNQRRRPRALTYSEDEDESGRKNDGPRHLHFGNVNSTSTIPIIQIESDEEDAINVKNQRRRPRALTYSEDEDESGSDKEEQSESGNGPETDTDDTFHPYEHVQEQGENSGDTQDRSDSSETENSDQSRPGNWSESDTDGDTTDENEEMHSRNSSSGTRIRKQTRNKTKVTTVLVEKAMLSHGNRTAHIWVQCGKNIRKYTRAEHENHVDNQRLIYKQTDESKRYSRKHKARYQTIHEWKKYDDQINQPPEVIEVKSWKVTEHQIDYEDFTICLEIVMKTVFDRDFLANVRNNKNENEKLVEAMNKMILLLDVVKKNVRSKAWKPAFTAIVETYPNKKVVGTVNTNLCQKACEVCKRQKSIATNVINFEGPKYDNFTLKELSSGEADKMDFEIGPDCFDRTDIYHNLHHYLYHLLETCKEKVEEHLGDSVDDVVFKIFTSEERWVEHEHYYFNRLLQRSAKRFDKYEERRKKKYQD